MKPFIKKYFLRNQDIHECNLNMDRQVCVIKTVAYRAWTDRQTDRQTHGTWTDKRLKTEGPKILSNYMFYFKTVIIGGPIICRVNLSDRVCAVKHYISNTTILLN